MLVEAGGRLVRHEEFRAQLWSNVVVEDRTLTVHMSTLRKALESSDLIETIARTGDRLAVPVRVSEAPSTPPIEAEGLVVRPFSTGDLEEDDRYLGIGIADTVGTALGAVHGLNVSPVGAVEEPGHDKVEASRQLARRACSKAPWNARTSGCRSQPA